jgi:hypothetical protein
MRRPFTENWVAETDALNLNDAFKDQFTGSMLAETPQRPG